MPDEEEQRAHGRPASPWRQDVECAGLQPGPLKDFDEVDWFAGGIDEISPLLPGGLESTGALDPDDAPPALAEDEKAFWQALVSSADTQIVQ